MNLTSRCHIPVHHNRTGSMGKETTTILNKTTIEQLATEAWHVEQIDYSSTQEMMEKEYVRLCEAKLDILKANPTWDGTLIRLVPERMSKQSCATISARKLAAASPVMEKLLEFLESNERTFPKTINFELRNFEHNEPILLDIFRKLNDDQLDQLQVTTGNSREIFNLAHLFQFRFLLHIVNRHEMSTITKDNAKQFLTHEHEQLSGSVFTKALSIVAANLYAITTDPNWIRSTPFQVETITKLKFLKLPGEESDLFNAVKLWLQSQDSLDNDSASKILLNIRFQHIPSAVVKVSDILHLFTNVESKLEILEYATLCERYSQNRDLSKEEVGKIRKSRQFDKDVVVDAVRKRSGAKTAAAETRKVKKIKTSNGWF